MFVALGSLLNRRKQHGQHSSNGVIREFNFFGSCHKNKPHHCWSEFPSNQVGTSEEFQISIWNLLWQERCQNLLIHNERKVFINTNNMYKSFNVTKTVFLELKCLGLLLSEWKRKGTLLCIIIDRPAAFFRKLTLNFLLTGQLSRSTRCKPLPIISTLQDLIWG